MKPEAYRESRRELAGWPVRVTSYRLGERYLARVDNVEPGATIARAEGPTREQAEAEACAEAERRLARTRRRP